MEKCQIELYHEFPVDRMHLYNAWLDSESHSAFTGGLAKIKSLPGSEFEAWDGYISGKILEVTVGRKILQTWRTSEFPESAESSYLEVSFEDVGEGCRLSLKHWNIPVDQVENYRQGWEDHYFNPMRTYFGT